jgi:hypothetical protein
MKTRGLGEVFGTVGRDDIVMQNWVGGRTDIRS